MATSSTPPEGQNNQTEQDSHSIELIPPTDWITPPTPGEVITSLMTGNSYVMGEKIGEGNFGVVYSCVDRWDNELAAKVMKARGTYDLVKQTTEAEFQKLLLLHHPYITYLFDAFEYRNTFYLITERCYCSVSNLFDVDDFYGLGWIKADSEMLTTSRSFYP